MENKAIISLGYVESEIVNLPSEYEVKFHGAKNKDGKFEIKLSDTNQIALAYTIDKLLQVEQRTGMAMCKLFADMDRKGITYGFDSAKKAIIAQTEYSDTTVESMIRVGKCFFKAEGTPVIYGIEDFTWASAQKLVTVKNNNDNNDLMGIANLQTYIDHEYITKDTPTRKIDEFKALLAKGFIPKEWVETQEFVDEETKEKVTLYEWYQADGLHTSEEKPYPDEVTADNKPQDNKGKDNKGKDNKGKSEGNKPQDNAPQDNAPNVKNPIDCLDQFNNEVNENTITLSDEENKILTKAVADIAKILKDKVFTI